MITHFIDISPYNVNSPSLTLIDIFNCPVNKI